MQQKMRMSVKSVADDGTFEGLLSPYGNVDDGNDMVEVGAFAKSMQEYGDTVPMLWQHKPDCPIGELTLDDRADGLWCKGKFLLEIPEAQKAYALLKAGVIKGLSIGYEAVKAQVMNGVRHLKEIRLYEGSVVTFPMNPAALVSSVKSGEAKGVFADVLGDIQLRVLGDHQIWALSSALGDLPWSGLSSDEMLSTAGDIIDEFRAAYLDYLGAYIDYLGREYGISTKDWKSAHEQKAGRTLSCATKKTLSDAHGHIKSAAEALDGLLVDDSDDPIEEDAEVKAAIHSMRTLLTA